MTRGKVNQLGGMSFDRSFAEILLRHTGLFPDQEALGWKIAAAILDIGFAIEKHGTGGALWILPAGAAMSGEIEDLGKRIEMSVDWWEPYREMWGDQSSTIRLLNPSGGRQHDFLQPAAQEWDSLRQRALTNSVSSLANVDGAIIINGTPEVLAFGVICNKFRNPTAHVLRSNNPCDSSVGEVVDASEFGGARHQSAIDFCSNNSPAGAVVASHDGGLTVFASLKRGHVLGSRVSQIQSSTEFDSGSQKATS